MKHLFRCNDLCEYEGEWLFSNLEFNALMRFNPRTKKIEFIDFFAEESNYKPNLHSKTLIYNEKVVFVPLRGKGVSIYDLNTKNIDFIKLSDKEAMISTAFILDGKLYLIPMNNISLAIYIDLRDYSLSSYKSLQEALREANNYFCDAEGIVLNDYKLVIAMFNTGELLEYDIKTNDYIYHKYENIKFDNIELINECLWCTSTDGGVIYKIDKEWKLESICIDSNSKGRTFFRIVEYHNTIYILPCFGDSIYRNNEEKWDKLDEHIPTDFYRINKDETFFWGINSSDKGLILFPKSGNGILEISDDNISIYEMKIDNDSYKDLMARRRANLKKKKEKSINMESEDFKLSGLIELLV